MGIPSGIVMTVIAVNKELPQTVVRAFAHKVVVTLGVTCAHHAERDDYNLKHPLRLRPKGQAQIEYYGRFSGRDTWRVSYVGRDFLSQFAGGCF